jgi:hypothetical protein
MDQLKDDLPELKMRRVWMSVLGSTTRDTHAESDGQPEDEDGLFDVGGEKARWPGDPNLSANERCNCQCSILLDMGMSDDEARQEIADYYDRQDQLQEDDAEKGFKGGSGSGNYHHGGRPGEVGGSGEGVEAPLKLKVVRQRAFRGEPVATMTTISKSETGKLGERIIISYLQQMMGKKDARHLNLDRNNFPIDLVQDHESVEVKAGLVSNGKDAQKWRLTIGEPGKKEKEWLKTASDSAKAKSNERKQQAIVERKAECLENLKRELGGPVKAKTMTVIINPDTKTADVFEFDGWHDRISWNSEQAKTAYKGTVKYG